MTTKLDCFGSVLLYEATDDYCSRCYLRESCVQKVAENKLEIEEALQRPVFEEKGGFWKGFKAMRKNKELAMSLSTAIKEIPVSKPAPAPESEAPAVVAVASVAAPVVKSAVPVKVREEIDRWTAKSVNVGAIKSGVNPFSGLDGVATALMITEGVLKLGCPTKRQLLEHLRAAQIASGQKVWTDASLQSNINIVTGAFKHLGYQVIREGK